MNNVQLVGRLTKDVELRYTPNGKANARITVAINRRFKNPQGETEADFISVVLWGQQAEFAANNVVKGNRVSVVGRIQTGSYEGQDGKRVYTTDVVAEQFQPIDWANSEQQTTQNNSPQIYGYNQQQAQKNYAQDPFPSSREPIEIDESDLPF